MSGLVRSLGDNIWAVDGPDVRFLGAKMHTRMTVVRLADGGLWVHSPIALEAAQPFLDEIGGDPVALIAPNKFHHLFIGEWRERWPHAVVFAESTVKQKINALDAAEDLTDDAHLLYANDIEQVEVLGNRLYTEVVFFHKPSATLILTDLMINLRSQGVAFLPALFLRFEQVLYPNGGLPRLYRWFLTDKEAGRRAVQKMLDWSPRQITLCHGEPFEDDAETVLRREFAWLLA